MRHSPFFLPSVKVSQYLFHNLISDLELQSLLRGLAIGTIFSSTDTVCTLQVSLLEFLQCVQMILFTDGFSKVLHAHVGSPPR